MLLTIFHPKGWNFRSLLWIGNTGAAWPSSARDVNRTLKWHNERNPFRLLYVSAETAVFNTEEGEDDVRSAWPLCPGLHTCYNAVVQWVAKPRGGANPIKPSSVRIEV